MPFHFHRLIASCIYGGVCLAVLAGCNVQPPRLFAPGPVEYQQQRATVHDPYAEVDTAPEVVGGRPRDYQAPRAEAVRDRPLWEGSF